MQRKAWKLSIEEAAEREEEEELRAFNCILELSYDSGLVWSRRLCLPIVTSQEYVHLSHGMPRAPTLLFLHTGAKNHAL